MDMAATDTPNEDMIRWEQPGADTTTWRLPCRGQSRFGTYEIDGPRTGPYDVRFTPHGGAMEVIERGVSARRAYYACPEHNKTLLGT
jgi:hypothetical protein